MTRFLVLALVLMLSSAAARSPRPPEDQILYWLAGDRLGGDRSGELEHLGALGVTTVAVPAGAMTQSVNDAAKARNLSLISTDDIKNGRDPRFAAAAVDAVGKGAGTNVLAEVFRADLHTSGGARGALRLYTFVSDPDVGPFALSVRKFMPRVSREELQKRVVLAHAMLLTLRGIPVIGFGDERGIVSTTGVDPLNQQIAELAHIRATHAALTHGLQAIRYSTGRPGLFAVSRFEPRTGREVLLLFNTSTDPVEQDIPVKVRSRQFDVVVGSCPLSASAPGRVQVELPALGYSVCDAR